MILVGLEVEMVPVVAHDIIGRLMIQCARQPGLAYVFSHIFEFDGNEIYIKEWPQLVGKTFEDVSPYKITSTPHDKSLANLFPHAVLQLWWRRQFRCEMLRFRRFFGSRMLLPLVSGERRP